MSVLAHHAALVASLAALAGTALRVASSWAPRGPERVLAAVSVACTAAVLESLALGLVTLGGSPFALTAAAALTWVAAARLLPRPAVSVRSELAGWWRARGGTGRVACCAALAASAWWAVWILLEPAIGFDASLYHYTEVATWVQQGRPGSVETISYGFPFGNYPLANEVLSAWGVGLAHSFVPLALWTPAALAVAGLAGWTGLRRLGVAPAAAGVALAALLMVPLVVTQLNEPQTDLPALAWLLVAGALAACAKERPGLMTPALLAAGLAVGTKTTTAPLVAVALLLGWRSARGRLPVRQLLAACAAVAVVGGLWYVRNLITHGSPLWPFAPGPFGDPTPAWLDIVDTTFLSRPLTTLREVEPREYLKPLGAAPLLLVAALVAPLVTRSREVLLAAGTTAVALLAWMNAPATGLPASKLVWEPTSWPVSTTRYLLPVLAAAVLTLALATRRRGWSGRLALGVLAAAAAGNLIVVALRGEPFLAPGELLLAAVAGAVLAGAGSRLAPARRARRARRQGGGSRARLATALALVALTVAMSVAAHGYVERHARSESTALGSDVVAWFSKSATFRDGDERISIASRAMISPLVGDRFQHRLELVPPNEACRVLRRRRGWLVVSEPDFAKGFLGLGDVGGPARCVSGDRPAFTGKNFDVHRLP